MKPGKRCRTSGKRAYSSHEQAVKAQIRIDATRHKTNEFGAYLCQHCRRWHITIHAVYDKFKRGTV
jgi:hypothetical protein